MLSVLDSLAYLLAFLFLHAINLPEAAVTTMTWWARRSCTSRRNHGWGVCRPRRGVSGPPRAHALHDFLELQAIQVEPVQVPQTAP
jgi:hypothetical protein